MYYYEIRILDISERQIQQISDILGVNSCSESGSWNYVVKKGDDESYSFSEAFLSILDGKYGRLEQIGVVRNQITFWVIYAYEGQCNMEFSSEEMLRMGQEGITLCVSCWEK